MRFLVAIASLVVLASARPDVSETLRKQGYAYKSPTSATPFFPPFSSRFGSSPSLVPPPAPVATRPPAPQPTQAPQPQIRYQDSFQQPERQKPVRPVVVPGEPVITKSYYVHAAPEDEEPEVEDRQHVVRPRKHYNIVFVKAPSPKASPGNNVNIFPDNEEKTIVYVLLGKNDGAQYDDNGELVIPPPKAPSKPEVVFVRYNNEQDAQRAIADIQSSYNSQPGPQLSVLGGDQSDEAQRSVGYSGYTGGANSGLSTPSGFRRN